MAKYIITVEKNETILQECEADISTIAENIAKKLARENADSFDTEIYIRVVNDQCGGNWNPDGLDLQKAVDWNKYFR